MALGGGSGVPSAPSMPFVPEKGSNDGQEGSGPVGASVVHGDNPDVEAGIQIVGGLGDRGAGKRGNRNDNHGK